MVHQSTLSTPNLVLAIEEEHANVELMYIHFLILFWNLLKAWIYNLWVAISLSSREYNIKIVFISHKLLLLSQKTNIHISLKETSAYFEPFVIIVR